MQITSTELGLPAASRRNPETSKNIEKKRGDLNSNDDLK
jgi:hypothetical protein